MASAPFRYIGEDIEVVSAPDGALAEGLQIKTCNDAKVRATAAKSPEKIGVRLVIDV